MKKVLLGIFVFFVLTMGYTGRAYADGGYVDWNVYEAYVINSEGITCDDRFFEYGTKISVVYEKEIDGKYYVCFSPVEGEWNQYYTEGDNISPVDEYTETFFSKGDSSEYFALVDTEIYAGPGFSYPVSAVIPKGSKVDVYYYFGGKYCEWPIYMYPVDYNGIRGWVLPVSVAEKRTFLASEYKGDWYARVFYEDAGLFEPEKYRKEGEKADITLPPGTVVKIVGSRRDSWSDKYNFDDLVIEWGDKFYFTDGRLGESGLGTPINVKIKVVDPEHLPVFKGYDLGKRVILDVEEGTILEGQVVYQDEYQLRNEYQLSEGSIGYIKIAEDLYFVANVDEEHLYGRKYWEKYEIGRSNYSDLFNEYDSAYNKEGSYVIEDLKYNRYNPDIETRSFSWKDAPDDLKEAKAVEKVEKTVEEKTTESETKEQKTTKQEKKDNSPEYEVKGTKDIYITSPAFFTLYDDIRCDFESSYTLEADDIFSVSELSYADVWRIDAGCGYYFRYEPQHYLDKPSSYDNVAHAFFIKDSFDYLFYESNEFTALSDIECFEEYSLRNSRETIKAGDSFVVVYNEEGTQKDKWYIQDYGWADMSDCSSKCILSDKYVSDTSSEELKETVSENGNFAEEKVKKAINRTIYICFGGAALLAVASAVGIVFIYRKKKIKQENEQ